MKKYHLTKNRYHHHGALPEKVKAILASAATDPNGSYTGIVTDSGYEVPVQDADDL